MILLVWAFGTAAKRKYARPIGGILAPRFPTGNELKRQTTRQTREMQRKGRRMGLSTHFKGGGLSGACGVPRYATTTIGYGRAHLS